MEKLTGTESSWRKQFRSWELYIKIIH